MFLLWVGGNSGAGKYIHMSSKAASSMICDKYYLWDSTTSRNILDTAQYTVLEFTTFQFPRWFIDIFSPLYTYRKNIQFDYFRRIVPSVIPPTAFWYETTYRGCFCYGEGIVIPSTAFWYETTYRGCFCYGWEGIPELGNIYICRQKRLHQWYARNNTYEIRPLVEIS